MITMGQGALQVRRGVVCTVTAALLIGTFLGGNCLVAQAEETASDQTTTNTSAADSSATDSVTDDMIGRYTEQGYENPAFGFKIVLPDGYTMEKRENGILQVFQTVGASQAAESTADIVEASNTPEAYSYARLQARWTNATLFTAQNDTAAIVVGLEGIGAVSSLYSSFDEESVIAQNSSATYEEQLSQAWGDGYEITDFQTNVAPIDFAGQQHYAGFYSCRVNGSPLYGAEIYLRSEDGQYILTVDITTTDPNEFDRLQACITSLS